MECGDSKDSGFMTALTAWLVLSIGNRSTKESILSRTLLWIQDKLHTSVDIFIFNHEFRGLNSSLREYSTLRDRDSFLYCQFQRSNAKNCIYVLSSLMFLCLNRNDRERQNLYSRTLGHLIQENWHFISHLFWKCTLWDHKTEWMSEWQHMSCHVSCNIVTRYEWQLLTSHYMW